MQHTASYAMSASLKNWQNASDGIGYELSEMLQKAYC